MAEIELFHYREGKGILHRLDTRLKLLFLILLSITIFKSLIPSLILISLFLFFIFLLEYFQSGNISPLKFIYSVRFFLVFMFFIILTRGLTIPGEKILFIPYLSIKGLISGSLYSWKLFLVILCGHTLTSTTDPSEIHGAVYKLLHRIPLIPTGTIATMISLTISFIPILFDQYLEVHNAGISRLGYQSKNPVKKISAIALPLLQTTIIKAEEIAQAMESRCYNDSPTLPEMHFNKKDLLNLVIMILFLSIIFLLNRYS